MTFPGYHAEAQRAGYRGSLSDFARLVMACPGVFRGEVRDACIRWALEAV